MAEFVPAVVILASIAAVVGLLAWIASRARGRRAGGAVLGAVDEIFHPAAHRPRIEVREQLERPVAPPVAGDQGPPAGP